MPASSHPRHEPMLLPILKLRWNKPMETPSLFVVVAAPSMRFGTISTSQEVCNRENSSLQAQVGQLSKLLTLVDYKLTKWLDGLKSNCPSRGIKYPLKHARHEPTHTTTIGHPEPTAPGIPFTGRGNLVVERLNRKHGCIISYGTWFSSGTCATFRAEKISGS